MKPEDYIVSRLGIKMPRILYGTAWKKDLTASLVEQAITTGFRGIDTACQPKHYHEPGVGEGLTACINKGVVSRPELYLQTKFTSFNGQDPGRIPYDPKASLEQQVNQSLETSLKNLQTTYLDCLVLHSPMATLAQTLEVWQAMAGFVKSGDVKQLGISNCYDIGTLQDLFHASETKPAIIQNRFYANSGYDREIRDFCQQQGIIYQSFWSLTANPHLLSDNVVQSLASRHQCTSAQILFRYLTQIGIVPLTGTTSTDHMKQDLAIFGFELADTECEAITTLLLGWSS